MGVRKVGQIAATGRPLFVSNTAEQSEWIVRPEWATGEQIRSFAGQPLVFGSETLGVIAVFSRIELSEIDIRWLRLFADHAAITIVNARAFEEIERLKRRLELENEYLREEISQSQAFGDIVGSSPVLKKVLEQIDLVADYQCERADPGRIRHRQGVGGAGNSRAEPAPRPTPGEG